MSRRKDNLMYNTKNGDRNEKIKERKRKRKREIDREKEKEKGKGINKDR